MYRYHNFEEQLNVVSRIFCSESIHQYVALSLNKDLLLKLRKMARSVFYYYLKHLKNKDKYVHERKSIRLIFHEHKRCYGYKRVTAEMRNRGYKINHKTVQRLMNEMGLKCKIRKVRYRSYKGEVGKITPNIIERNFIATEPNCKWAT